MYLLAIYMSPLEKGLFRYSVLFFFFLIGLLEFFAIVVVVELYELFIYFEN